MRFENSLRNSSVMMIGQIINILLGFLLRTVFIRTLGQEYSGLNGVFESVLMLLSLAELGFGTSAAFALYKPIADDNKKKIGALMALYRQIYHVIAIVTVVLGIILIPFLDLLTKNASQTMPYTNVTLIYLLFLTNTVLSYLFSYKRTLICAYQMHYINSINENVCLFVKYILQGAILLLIVKTDSPDAESLKNAGYIAFMVIQVLSVFISNLAIAKKCNKMYPWLKEYSKEKLEKEETDSLKKSVISLLYQRISSVLVTGTDNIMITYAGIALMGVYYNYQMIIQTVFKLLEKVFQSIMASVGDMMVSEGEEHSHKVYKEMNFVTFVVFSVIVIAFAGVMQRFIELWAGKDWVLSNSVLAIVLFNFFITGMREPNKLVIDSAGLFNYLRPKAVFEVIVNLVMSLLFLVKFKMGIYGVLLGTSASLLSTCFWWEPYVVYKHGLKKKLRTYFLRYAIYFVFTAIVALLNAWICSIVPIKGFLGVIICGCVSVAIAGIAIITVFGRTREFNAIKSRFLSILKEKVG